MKSERKETVRRLESVDRPAEDEISRAAAGARERKRRVARSPDGANSALKRCFERIRREPDCAFAHLELAAELEDAGRLDHALDHYRGAAERAPRDPAVLDTYGEALLGQGKLIRALKVFRRSFTLDPGGYESGLALSGLMRAFHAETAAREVLERVIRRHPIVIEETPDPRKSTVLRVRGFANAAYRILKGSDGTYRKLLRGGHFSLGHLLEEESFNFILLNILEDNVEALRVLPKFDLVINTIADPDRERSSLLALARFADRHGPVAVINPPRRVLETTRDRNYHRFGALPGIGFPRTERLSWDGRSVEEIVQKILQMGLGFPVIVRKVGTHTGTSMFLAENTEALRSYFSRSSSGNGEYYMIEFKDCRTKGGLFHKRRMFCIDGAFYPVANLYHTSWNVHSGNRYSVMDKTPWMRKEEKAFLEDFAGSIGRDQFGKLCMIRDIMGLDFWGMDFTILQDGTLFLFEVNAAMRHNFDHAGNFPYTKRHLETISAAFHAMLQSRLARQTPRIDELGKT